jgi:nucleotide-binding universal stress UspA family protein
MYNKVVLAADGSDESRAAARELAKFIDKGLVEEVIILNVTHNFIDNYQMPVMNIADMDKIVQDLGHKIVSATSDIFKKENVIVSEKIILGSPAATICEVAEQENADLIVMGSRGKNPVSGLFLGSVSTRVLQFATCPVLIVKR